MWSMENDDHFVDKMGFVIGEQAWLKTHLFDLLELQMKTKIGK